MKNKSGQLWKNKFFWISVIVIGWILFSLSIYTLLNERKKIEVKSHFPNYPDTIANKIDTTDWKDSTKIPSNTNIGSKANDVKDLVNGKIKSIKGISKAIVPKKMTIGKPSSASLVIGKRKTKKLLEKRVMELSRTSDSTQIFSKNNLTFGKYMKAILIDPNEDLAKNFQIKELTESEQYVDLENYESVDWLWNVTPLNEGSHDLYMRLDVIILDDGEKNKKSITLFNEKINVSAAQKETTFTDDYSQSKPKTGYEAKKPNKENENSRYSTFSIIAFVIGILLLETFLLFYIGNFFKNRKSKKKYNLDFLSKEEEVKVETYLKNDDLEKAISLILSRIGRSNNELKNDLILLLSNYKSNNKNYTLNIISYEEFGREKSKQVYSMIKLMNNAKKEKEEKLPLTKSGMQDHRRHT